MEKALKGDQFTNRYRITGTLKTLSPLHIGTGESSRERFAKVARQAQAGENDETPEVSLISKDFQGKPLIPGSTLRGVLRHWLFNVLTGFGPQWASIHDYAAPGLADLTQAEQNEIIKQDFSWLELLFGTPLHEGKLEIWDAPCKTPSLPAPDALLGWKADSLTYIDTSVAIDPATGTAIDNLLYKTEVAPPGLEFDFNLVGQNLNEFEVGLVLLGLSAFNSSIYPIKVGGRGGRGYGRLEYTPGPVYCLGADNLKDWIAGAVQALDSGAPFEGTDAGFAPAGYFNLPRLSADEQRKLIQAAKEQLLGQMETGHG